MRLLLVIVQAQEPVPEVADGHARGVAVGEGGAVWVTRPYDDAAFTGGLTPRLRPGGGLQSGSDACVDDGSEAPAGARIRIPVAKHHTVCGVRPKLIRTEVP